jgi:acetyl-CoA carboxylase biotin carboxylase subunit
VVSDIDQTIDLSKRLGLPVILKSLYGGGGRGMKVAYTENQLRSQFANVSSEANAAFGRNEVYIEHYISSPRHLEVQVLADEYGNIQVLSDRECSIQRRHQKIIEEAPIPNIDQDVRECLWKWSRMIIQAIGFRGLGTVEFLMNQKGSTYFLEINGRLQVEHPVTEMVTGIDMVREQIMIAAGSRLDGSSIPVTGHAIECRLNAENPGKNFMPTTGTINTLRLPGGPGTRVDTHLFPGCDISSFYDPLLVKLIAHNKTRGGALRRMTRMLEETTIDGITTNKDLLRKLLNNDQFLAGNGDTSLVTQLIDK